MSVFILYHPFISVPFNLVFFFFLARGTTKTKKTIDKNKAKGGFVGLIGCVCA